jgi:hypothetical protein
MEIFKTKIKIKLTAIVSLVLFIITIIVLVLFLNTEDNDKIGTILGSVCAGLIVALIQFFISWQDYKQTEKLRELELIEVLYDRDDRTFYENYIKKSKRKISMMGVTGGRFFKDFADDSQNATSNAKVLIEALNRGVIVRILLPELDFVDENKKNDVKTVIEQAGKIKEKFPNHFEIKHFKHVPAHSIFCIDDKCIVGPVFPELESKYTPALYLHNSSPIADRYLKYFENEWGKAID